MPPTTARLLHSPPNKRKFLFRRCLSQNKGEISSPVYIPKGLLEEILIRLPVKSLVRFESVCKTWRRMFHSRSFVRLYRCHHLSFINCSFDLHTTSMECLEKMAPKLSATGLSWLLSTSSNTKAEDWNQVVRTFGPLSNGIYCLSSHLEDYTGCVLIRAGKIALCNPATNDCKFTDPFPSFIHCKLEDYLLKHCQFNLGFGIVRRKSSGSYHKVVILLNYGLRFSRFLSFVYSFQTGEWKMIVDYKRGVRNTGGLTVAFDVQMPYEVCPQSYFQGCWHWMVLTEAEHDGFLSVLSFNFAKEVFKIIGGPPHVLDHDIEQVVNTKGSVFVLRDHLAVIHLFDNDTIESPRCVAVSVWMMKEHGVEESWTRIYSMRPNFYGGFSRLVGIESCLENVGICVKKVYFDDGNKRIISCDDSTSKIFCDWDGSASVVCWNTPGISTYVPSLKRL